MVKNPAPHTATTQMNPTQQQLNFARKQKAFAWAKYYEAVNQAHTQAVVQYVTLTTTATDVAVPAHIKTTLKEMADQLKKKFECPICLEMIESEQLEITNCGHYYCKGCLTAHKAAERATQTHVAPDRQKWSCATCRRKHGFKPDEE
jgi:transcription elongation factor Elf1